MNNHLKKMLLGMVVTVAATAPAHAYYPSIHRVNFEQAYASLAKITSSLCGAAKDVVVESVGAMADAVLHPLDSLDNLATAVHKNPRRALRKTFPVAIVGTILAYVAYTHYHNAQEEASDEMVSE